MQMVIQCMMSKKPRMKTKRQNLDGSATGTLLYEMFVQHLQLAIQLKLIDSQLCWEGIYKLTRKLR